MIESVMARNVLDRWVDRQMLFLLEQLSQKMFV
jgi:hypothetical protein